MSKMKRSYEEWQRETLQKAKDAMDLRDLREVFYELGDRWEFDQATGAWLESSEPLDTVGFVLRMPGLKPHKERFVVYAVMAYSKGLTDSFDHLGDKERIIIERDLNTKQIQCWSTTGHGLMDIFPIDLSDFKSIETALEKSYLVAQPGDHALRIEIPSSIGLLNAIIKRLWDIAGGAKSFHTKTIDVLTADDIENSLDFKFHRYASSVVELDNVWRHLSGSTVDRAKEKVLDKIPDHIEERDRLTLRKIEGLMYILWFKPPYEQMRPIQTMYEELQSEPTPTDTQRTLVPLLGEIAYSLTDLVEKAKYLNWKSVIDQKSFSESDAFRGLELTNIERAAFAAALEDILKEHTLAYIGFPEKATIKNKVMRVALGSIILPIRLLSSFLQTLREPFWKLLEKTRSKSTSDNTKQQSTESEDATKPS